MCGRFGLTANSKEIGRLFSVHNVPEVKPDYNIPPTRGVLGIRSSGTEREMHRFHWGLIPSWAKDEEIGYKLINARSETVASKPSFRSAFKTRRLIVPASYYYEWQKDGKEKIPFLIRLKDAEVEYSLRGMGQPLGVATYSQYKTLGDLPEEVSKYLPTEEAITERLLGEEEERGEEKN